MAAGTAAAVRHDKPEHEKPVEQTLTTPTVQPLANAGRTSSFLTGSAPDAHASRQQPGMAGPAAAAAPAAAAVSSPSTPTVQSPSPRTSPQAQTVQTPTTQTPTTQTPPAAPFPTGGAGMGVGMGAVTGTAATSAPETQRRPDPLTDPLPGLGLPASSTGSKSPVPEPLEIVCREERLDISTEWHVLGRARLRKYVTSEQVERRVPVVRERIRVERVPVSAEERAQLTEAEIAESVEEVTLHEERLVVKKTVVPVERIRLVTERVTEEEVVREQLHREHIQVQDGSKPAGTPVTPASAPANGGYSTGTPTSHTQPSPTQPAQGGQSPTGQLRASTPMGPTRNSELPGHALGA
ncbi:YsnF/AvaK domain-containing protein [Streptacidiphilus anmyonensis]|uniref:YsnF/AvaK domain-containing protein n=1 Tax=Streptacidiphilus anmyonensis TaxID=405782 RepID=UPI0034E25C07